MPKLPGNLDKLLKQGKTKNYITSLEKFRSETTSTPLRDLLTPENDQHIAFTSLIKKIPQSIIDPIKITLTPNANNTTLEDSLNTLKDLKARLSNQRMEVNKDSVFTGENKSIKEDIFKNLAAAGTRLDAQISVIKKQLEKKISNFEVQTKADSEITTLETLLEEQKRLFLETKVKSNNDDHDSVIALYKLISKTPLCLSRYLGLLEIFTNESESTYTRSVEACLNLIKETLEKQRHADETKAFKPITGDITLNDLSEIKNWSAFRVSLTKKLKAVQNAILPEPIANESSEETIRLLQIQNAELRQIINQLKTQNLTISNPETIASTSVEIDASHDKNSNLTLTVEETPLSFDDDEPEEFLSPLDKAETLKELQGTFEKILSKRDSEIEVLLESNAQLREELSDLKGELSKKKLDELRGRNGESEENKDNGPFTTVLRRQREQIEKLKQESKNLSTEFTAKIEALEKNHQHKLEEQSAEHKLQLSETQRSFDEKIKELENTKTAVEQERNKNKTEVTRLEQAIHALQNEHKRFLAEQVAENESKLSKLEKIFKEEKTQAEVKIDALKAQLTELLGIKEQLAEEKIKNRDLNEKYDAQRREFHLSQQRIDELEGLNKTLADNNSFSLNTLGENNQELTRLKEALDLEKRKLSSLTQEKLASDNALATLQTTYDQLQQKQEKKISDLEAKLSDAETTHDKQAQTIETLNKNIRALEKTHKKNLEAQAVEHQHKLVEAEQAYQKTLTELSTAKDQANEKREANHKEVIQLKQTIQQLNNNHKQLLEAQTKEHEWEVSELKRNFAEEKAKTGQLEAQLSEINANKQQLEREVQEKTALLNEKNAYLTSENLRLTETLVPNLEKQLSVEMAENKQQQTTLELVRKELIEKEHVRQQAIAEATKLKEQIACLNVRVEDLTEKMQKYEGLERKLSEVESEKRTLQDEIAALNSKTDELQQLNISTAEQDKLKDQRIVELQNKLTLLEEQIQALTEEKGHIGFDKQGYDKTLHDMVTELAEKEDKLNHLTSKNEGLSREIERLVYQNNELRSNLIKVEMADMATQVTKEDSDSHALPLDITNGYSSRFSSRFSSRRNSLSSSTDVSSTSSRYSSQENLDTDDEQRDTFVKEATRTSRSTINPVISSPSSSKNSDYENETNESYRQLQSDHSDADSHSTLSDVQLDDRNLRGIAMTSEQQANELFKNPQFIGTLEEKLTDNFKTTLTERLKTQFKDYTQIENLLKSIEPQIKQSSNQLAVNGRQEHATELQDALSELLTAKPDLVNNNERAAAALSQEVIISDNCQGFRMALLGKEKELNETAQRAQEIINTLSDEDIKEGLYQFTIEQLQALTINAAKVQFPDSDWQNSDAFKEAIKPKLEELGNEIIVYLFDHELAKTTSKLVEHTYDNDNIIVAAKGYITHSFRTLSRKNQQEEKKYISELAETIGVNAAIQLQQTQPQQPLPTSDNDSGHPSSSPHASLSSSSSLPLEPLSNPFPPSRSNDEHENETIPMKPIKSTTPPNSRASSETDLGSEDSFTDPNISNPNLKPERKNQARSIEDLNQKLLSLQYAAPNNFFLSLEAICSADAEFKDYIKNHEDKLLEYMGKALNPETKQTLAHNQIEKFRLAALQTISEETTTLAEEDKTSNAEVWLNKKLQLITEQTLPMNLSEDEKLRLTQAIQKQFSLHDLTLSAVTLKTLDELDTEIEKLKQYDLKLVAQTYQEFSKIESLLPQYPALIKERDNDISSQSEDEGFDDQSELEHFHASLNLKISSNHNAYEIEQPEAQNLIELISKHIEPPYRKWGLIGTHLDPKLVTAIADALNLQDEESNKPANKKIIVTSAINLLEKEYQLTDTLKAREAWIRKIKLHYAATQEIARLRSQAKERITVLQDMHAKKTLYDKEDKQRETERTVGAPTEDDKKIDRSTLGQPLPVYLPNACRIIEEDSELEQQKPNVIVQGGLFHRRDTLGKNESVLYEQDLGNKKQRWSVTRTQHNTLAYKTKSESRWNLKSVTKKEVAFTQMVDAVQSFKDSNIIHFNFNNCSKQTEKKYRIFIRAYNELAIGPSLYCPVNSKLQAKTSEIEAAKNVIRKQLNLQTEELDTNTKNLQRLASDSILETENLKTSTRIR